MSLHPVLRVGSGGWIRTNDLRVMSPTSYLCSTPHSIISSWKSAAKVALFFELTRIIIVCTLKLTFRMINIKYLQMVFNKTEKGFPKRKGPYFGVENVNFRALLDTIPLFCNAVSVMCCYSGE